MLNFGMILQSFEMSVRNIRGNRTRSFLTMLGIIIGVASVISLITIVSLATSSMMGQFSSMGAGSVTVTVFGTPLKKGLSENDLSEIAAIELVDSVSPEVGVSTYVVYESEIYKKITVSGRSEQYFLHNGSIAKGRVLLPTDMDGSVNVCVINESAEKTLFKGRDGLNQQIQIGGIQYRVAGIISKKNSVMDEITAAGSNDDQIYIPYKNALRINNTNALTSIEVYAKDGADMDEMISRMDVILKSAFNNADDSYFIMNMASLVSALDSVTGMMSALLGGIASIALIVGGIGIMNMMLVSVTERTREIGLRKALGAEPAVIQIQFLLESVILSLFGGIIGIVIGELISFVAAKVMDIPFHLNAEAILLGFFFSLTVGVIFGWAPARRASRLNPIDALRSE